MKSSPQSFSFLLEKKQASYLYQYLNLSIVGIFLVISLVMYLFWNINQLNDKLIYWYFLNLAILALRSISNVFYHKAKSIDNPLTWIYLFTLGSCLNGIVIAMLIFLVPPDNPMYHTLVLFLLGAMLFTSITSLGVFRRAFYTYVVTLSIPVIMFYSINTSEGHLFHLFVFMIFFIFTGITALYFNKSQVSSFIMEIENNSLKNQLNIETDNKILAQNKLLHKTTELQNLNKNLENKVKEKTNELETLAFYDTLTQLPNRYHFLDYLERTLSRNKITRETFALFFIDLDEFKSINDTLGHDFGDQLLVNAASRLRESIRVDDFIARISGDEFTIILKNIPSEDELAKVAQNIIQTISHPYIFHETQTYVSCSIGIALYPQDGENTHTLLKYSDLAMYHAKENGKNGFYFYNQSLYEKKARKFILVTELKTAIEKNELHLVYQPQVHTQDGKISSMEVLLRWNSNKFGPVPVGKFIPLAEESNLILELEQFVLKTALTQVKYWNAQSEQIFTVGINISGIHFQQKGFAEEIEGLLCELEIDPAILELELTESAIMKNTQESIDKLSYLKSLGIRISIDDFGTGYSSMSYLKQLPIDTLKIDKSFIDGIPDDQDNKAITQAIIILAQQFNLETIAEGVENNLQLEFLKQAGCNLIQGYLHYKPLSAEDFEKEFNLDIPPQMMN